MPEVFYTPQPRRVEGERCLIVLPGGEERWLQPPARAGRWLILDVSADGPEAETLRVTAVSLEGDFFRLVVVRGGPAACDATADVRSAWAPLLAPRPDLAAPARQWLEASEDLLAPRGMDALARDPANLLSLMPPLIGPAFVRRADASAAPVLVNADGSTDELPALPLAPGEPRRYAVLFADGPVLVVSWGEDNFALYQHLGDVVARLVWADGRLSVEPAGDETLLERFCAALSRPCPHPATALPLRVADERLQAALETCLALGVYTFRGLLPRYGVGCYDEPPHHSFPPATTFLVETLLLLGHVAEAERYLAAYLLRYGREDGSLDYYGPSRWASCWTLRAG